MSSESSTFTNNTSSTATSALIPNAAKFWSYLSFLIPAIVCSLFVLYHLFFDRALRRALNNHAVAVVLILGLICQITIYPWMLYFY